jgi:hypothetical protein
MIEKSLPVMRISPDGLVLTFATNGTIGEAERTEEGENKE